MSNEISSFREFGKFRLDVTKKILWHSDEIVSLQKKAVELLIALTEKEGEVFSKESLLNKVWDDSLVEESNLSRNIYLLRKTLKSYDGQDYIQTLARRGYRFTGEIIKSDENIELFINPLNIAPAQNEIPKQEIIEEKPEFKPKDIADSRSFALRKLLFSSVVMTILLVAGFIYWRLNQNQDKVKLKEIKSIAVLPLNQLNEIRDEALSLRIADALITKLGSLEQISVRPTSSVMTFTKGNFDPLEAGKQLAVDAILDGRIQQEGEKVRVTLQLISVKNGEQLWSEQFDGRSDEILNLQDEISLELSKALLVSTDQKELFSKNSTDNPEAFESYLRGRYLWNMRTGKNLLKAMEEFEKATQLDPNFALAYAGLADCYALLSVYEIKPSHEVFPVAREKAQMALNINPNLAEAHATLGFINYRYDWDWRNAELELQKSISLKPNYPTAYHWYGEMLMASGRFAEAETQYKKALELDPTSLIINTDLGYGLFLAHRYDESINQLQKTVNLNSNFPLAYYCLADSLAYNGISAESVKTFKKWQELTEVNPADIKQIETAFQKNGYEEYLKARLKWSEIEAEKNNFTKTDVARFYAEIKDNETALKWLRKAHYAHDADLIFIKTHPAFDSLHNDNRFREILKNMNYEN